MDFVANGEGIGGIEGGGKIILNVPTAASSFLNFNAPGDRTFSGVIEGGGGDGFYQSGGGILALSGPSTFTTAPSSTAAPSSSADVRPNQAGPGQQRHRRPRRRGVDDRGRGTAHRRGSRDARPVETRAIPTARPSRSAGAPMPTHASPPPVILAATTRLTSATLGPAPSGSRRHLQLRRGAGIVKVGPGTVSLDAANTFTGPTVVNEGTLVLAAAQCRGGEFGRDRQRREAVLGADQTLVALDVAKQAVGDQGVDLAGRDCASPPSAAAARRHSMPTSPVRPADGITTRRAGEQAVGVTDSPGDHVLIRLTRLGDANVDGW